jgi:hypothetical protein
MHSRFRTAVVQIEGSRFINISAKRLQALCDLSVCPPLASQQGDPGTLDHPIPTLASATPILQGYPYPDPEHH